MSQANRDPSRLFEGKGAISSRSAMTQSDVMSTTVYVVVKTLERFQQSNYRDAVRRLQAIIRWLLQL